MALVATNDIKPRAILFRNLCAIKCVCVKHTTMLIQNALYRLVLLNGSLLESIFFFENLSIKILIRILRIMKFVSIMYQFSPDRSYKFNLNHKLYYKVNHKVNHKLYQTRQTFFIEKNCLKLLLVSI